MSLSSDLVVDASAMMSYLLGEESGQMIFEILKSSIERGVRLLTLELAYVEVVNALWRACMLRNLFDEKTAFDSLNSLFSLPLESMRLDRDLTLRALALALKAKLPVYDTL